MAISNNPYGIHSESHWDPKTRIDLDGRSASDSRVPDSIMHLLEQTRGWVLFFSLLGFLLTALFAFVSAFMIFGGFLSTTSGTGFFFSSAAYVLAAIVFAIPSHFLWQLSYWIERASLQPTWRELEEVVRAQRLFWQVSGILAAFLIALILCLAACAAFVL
ncbi:MAG: hypothetical protein NXI32_03930 [bacterium]|nr:hypothetical protein [bacterium]